jgi:hypothetical protein
MMLSFVRTPMVRRPFGSISRAMRRESELAISEFAGDIARMMALIPCCEFCVAI